MLQAQFLPEKSDNPLTDNLFEKLFQKVCVSDQ